MIDDQEDARLRRFKVQAILLVYLTCEVEAADADEAHDIVRDLEVRRDDGTIKVVGDGFKVALDDHELDDIEVEEVESGE